MKRRKVLVSLGVGIVSVCIFLIYSNFNGSFIGEYIAKDRIETYMLKEYKDKPISLNNISYDFKYNGYIGEVLLEDENRDFNIYVRRNGFIYDEYKSEGDRLIDSDLMSDVSVMIENEFEKFIDDERFSPLTTLVIYKGDNIDTDNIEDLNINFAISVLKNKGEENILLDMTEEEAIWVMGELSEHIKSYEGLTGIFVNFKSGNTKKHILIEKDKFDIKDKVEDYIADGYIDAQIEADGEIKFCIIDNLDKEKELEVN